MVFREGNSDLPSRVDVVRMLCLMINIVDVL
jgi:hypothetical protein